MEAAGNQEQIRICLVVSGPNTEGGIERHLRDLSSGLSDLHDVHVVAHHSFEPLFAPSVSFHNFPFTKWRFNVLMYFQLIRKLKQLKPSIVHVHGRKAAVLVGRVKRFVNAPCVLTLHNLSSASRIVRKFEAVIAVSRLVAEGVSHSNLHVVHNGC